MPIPDSTSESNEVLDPVCGMTIDPADAVGHVDYKGQTYYFCADSCLARFRKNPEEFLKPAADRIPNPESRIPAGAKWTCPMHPEIVRDAPGSCPICGMALEPMTVTAEEPENKELRDMTRRFWVSAVLTAAILVLSMGGFELQWLELALATPVVL